jgi:hypothetical protein
MVASGEFAPAQAATNSYTTLGDQGQSAACGLRPRNRHRTLLFVVDPISCAAG